MAAINGRIDVIPLLLAAGADPNRKSDVSYADRETHPPYSTTTTTILAHTDIHTYIAPTPDLT